MIKDVSIKTVYTIEFFHIYSDQALNEVSKYSKEYYKIITNNQSIDYRTVILLDDYNPKMSLTSTQDVSSYLKSDGIDVDMIYPESGLVEYAKKVLNILEDKKLKRNYEKYIETHGKFPCSLLTASWYLLRLGVLSPEGVDIEMLALQRTSRSDENVCYRVVNILPISYSKIEKKALNIIKSTPYKDSAHFIQNLYFPDRDSRAKELF